jgi:hypothetical protein
MEIICKPPQQSGIYYTVTPIYVAVTGFEGGGKVFKATTLYIYLKFSTLFSHAIW